MNQQQRDDLARALGISAKEQSVLDSGGEHPYKCKCDICLQWWLTVGPEEEEDGKETWGPFTQEEINQARAKQNESKR